MHFSYALHNHLEGQAAFILGDELDEIAVQSLEAARKLADRIGELGGEVTADPTQFVERSPLGEFSLPASKSEVGIILSFVLERICMIIREYKAFLKRVRGRDFASTSAGSSQRASSTGS